VVATRGGGIEEYVVPGRNGELVIAGDVDGLARAIGDLLPRAAAMAAAARADAARFGTEVVAAAVADALREALARRNRAAA
jgi:glycosyltransferase involved in cell wall biosynthesis